MRWFCYLFIMLSIGDYDDGRLDPLFDDLHTVLAQELQYSRMISARVFDVFVRAAITLRSRQYKTHPSIEEVREKLHRMIHGDRGTLLDVARAASLLTNNDAEVLKEILKGTRRRLGEEKPPLEESEG